MTEEEIDMKNGETAWKALTDLLTAQGNKQTLMQAEMMVKTIGADSTYKFCRFEEKLPEEVSYLMKSALRYLEHEYQNKSKQQ